MILELAILALQPSLYSCSSSNCMARACLFFSTAMKSIFFETALFLGVPRHVFSRKDDPRTRNTRPAAWKSRCSDECRELFITVWVIIGTCIQQGFSISFHFTPKNLRIALRLHFKVRRSRDLRRVSAILLLLQEFLDVRSRTFRRFSPRTTTIRSC
jgi:hypothetical protein